MGVPGADVRYVLESLAQIEDALCRREEDEALELLRILKEELEAIA